jgi:hypothetical protein
VNHRIAGAALSALHKYPAQAWTLEDFARMAGTSRRREFGAPPATWRRSQGKGDQAL